MSRSACSDCSIEDCSQWGTDKKPLYPCCIGGCKRNACWNWNNCEEFLHDDFYFPFLDYRLKADELVDEWNYLKKNLHRCESEMSRVYNGEYDDISDIFTGVSLHELKSRVKGLEFEIRRLRKKEFEEFKSIRRCLYV